MHVESGQLICAMANDRLATESAGVTTSLLARAKAGDAQAFEAILVRYERQVMGTALRLLGHREDAEDAAQEVFLRLYKYLSRFDETRELSPWLYRITVNVCRSLAKKRKRTAACEAERRSAKATASAFHYRRAELAEQRQIVLDGLKRLPEKERAALVLRDIEGLSTKEVARVLGSSETTVRSQISRARLKLKRFRDKALGGDQ